MPEIPGDAKTVSQLLVRINQITLRAVSEPTKKGLIFVILNETHRLVPYDRATLWDIASGTPIYLGVSGQIAFEANSPVVRDLSLHISDLKSIGETQAISLKSIPGSSQELSSEGACTALWLPMFTSGHPSIGMLLERWHPDSWTAEELKVLTFMRQGYGVAWRHFAGWRQRLAAVRKTLIYSGILSAIVLFLVPVPLRVVAPSEVVADHPYLITAPLDGLIDHVAVHPGDSVAKGDLLFSYDKDVPLQELAVAEKAVGVAEAELNRSLTLGWNDAKSLNDAAVYKLQLDKEKLNYDLAKYRANQLDVTSPINGVTIFDDPDRWRDKPVVVGDTIMIVADPKFTKIRLWVPEADKITLDLSQPIKIFLNIEPSVSYEAHIRFISDYSAVNDRGVHSFVAEADWVKQPPRVELGLKGSAILYGDNVSIFYFIMRKPWNTVREFLGI